MKKFLLSIALVFFASVTMAQNTLEQGNIISVTTLQNSTAPQKIAIKNIDSKNNLWFSATKNSETLTGSEVFFWIPVEDSETLFYLKKACSAVNEGYVMLTSNSTNQGGGAKSLGIGSKENAIKFQAVTPTYSGTPVESADKDNIVRFNNEDNSNWINCELSHETPSFRNNPGTGTFTIHNVYDMNTYKLLTTHIVKDGDTTTEYTLHKEGDEITMPSYEGYNSDYTPTTKDATDTQVITVNYSIIEEVPLVKMGQFYTINLTPLYTNNDRTGASMYVHSDARLRCNRIADKLEAKNVFTFEIGTDGNTYMKNIATQTYISRIGANASQDAIYADSEAIENAMSVTFGVLGEETANGNTVKIIEIQPGNNAMLNCAEVDGTGLGRVVSFTPGSDKISKASAWYLTEVTEFSHTLNIGDTGYATLILGFNAEIPTIDGDDNGVFIATESTIANSVHLTKVEGVLPAKTAVIVKADPNSSVVFRYSTETPENIEENLLTGTLYDKNITDDAYVLAKDGNDVCFGIAEKNQLDNSAFKNNANKTYLPANAVSTNATMSANLRFDFGGTTAIEDIREQRAESKDIFDLAGRRINKIVQAGIYIINGRKVLIK